MDGYKRFLRAACTALIAALMAGCAAFLALRAPGFAIPWLPVYAMAFLAAALVQLSRRGALWMIGCLAAGAAALAILLAMYLPRIADMARELMQAEAEFIPAAHAAAAQGLALLVSLLLGALFALLLHGNAGAPFALLAMLAAMICALAINEEISLWAALPGMIAGVAAFALPGDVRREGVRPALLAPAAGIVLLALIFVPAARTTWAPMEQLADRLRSVVEDYIHFTEERLAFSIHEEGYNRVGMIGDEATAMLGGPANPSDAPVMRVSADASLLLRGSIKRTYTGYAWVDEAPKARYLYYDFTHRGVRNAVFNGDNAKGLSGFQRRSAQIEMLSEGTSTLFVPAQLAQFDMGLADAVYYNSAGEIFLTRKVQPGDSYAVSAYLPENASALISACAALAAEGDSHYAQACADYLQLPEGIDAEVYALAAELSANSENAAEKAYAIQEYLAKNYRYTLDGRHPEGNRDFVSWFLLEEKQGYCSYFASAMTVLCRMAGMPARYVEGYYLPAADGEIILSGRNAHAWVEVYFNGLGWIAFDPTARTVESQGEQAAHGDGSDSTGGDESDAPSDVPNDIPNDNPDNASGDAPTPTPDVGSDPEPTIEPNAGNLDSPQTSPSPSPNPDDDSDDLDDSDDSDDAPNDPPPDAPQDSENEDESERHIWRWLLLALLLAALIALAVFWMKKRLLATDPLRMISGKCGAPMAAMILYRANLTLLAQLGFAPQGGETPQAFAARVCAALPNPAYEAFAADVACSRYSGRNVNRECIAAGREAYLVFLHGMRRLERLRYHLRRALHGLGSFERIP